MLQRGCDLCLLALIELVLQGGYQGRLRKELELENDSLELIY